MELYVYGASGHGKVVADIARACGHTVVGFLDDDDAKNEYANLPCLRPAQSGTFAVALGVGDNRARERIYVDLRRRETEIITLIHPSACISPSAVIKRGTVVMPYCVVNADAIIGNGAIVNTGAIIEHDCVVDEFVHISPNAALAGGVFVGARTHIGIGANVIQLIEIGSDVIIGAGAVVTHDIASHALAVGVPAYVKRSNQYGE